MSTATPSEFSALRSIFWPIHRYELKKLLPMLLMFFFINYNYTMLRTLKDTLMVTVAGAEALPTLKLFGVLPAAILFMMGYNWLLNRFSQEKAFYIVISCFLGFLALFMLVLYPAREALFWDGLPRWVENSFGSNAAMRLKGTLSMLKLWPFSLFYIVAELWGSVALSLLFWGLANATTAISESKRFYAVLGIGANIASIPVFFTKKSSDWLTKLWQLDHIQAFEFQLRLSLCMVLFAGCGVLFLYYWIQTRVMTDPHLVPATPSRKKSKEKMGLGASFKYLINSKYLLCIAALVIAYGVSIQLVEVVWKHQARLLYPTQSAYSDFMVTFQLYTSIFSSFMMLFVGGNVVRHFGWTKAALVTPIVILVTGILFFAFGLFETQLAGLALFFSTTPLALSVLFGTIQNILSKGTKYSLFDPTKEMAYIPLDLNTKSRGKAAVDVLAARFGKSGGAAINYGLMLALGSIEAITPYVAGILFIIIGAWILAARSLGRQFATISGDSEGSSSTPSIKEEKHAEGKKSSGCGVVAPHNS